jgi:hypothetical protein
MALADALNAAQEAAPKRMRCSIALLLEQLPDKDAEILGEALRNSAFAHSQILEALKVEYPDRALPSLQTIGHHRRGRCRCGA